MKYPVRNISTNVQYRKWIESSDVLIQHDIASIRTLALGCIGIFLHRA